MPGRTPVSRLLRHFGALATGVIVSFAVACSGTGEPTGPGESAPTDSPTRTPTAAPTLTETPEPTAALTPSQPDLTPAPTPALTPSESGLTPTPSTDYDSNENMYRLFSGRDHSPEETHEAITLAVANNDKSMVPLLIEMLRFFGDWELVTETNTALSVITGRESGDDSGTWNEWMEWLGKNSDEYRPPKGYVRWKSELMSLIDPRFGEFLAPAAEGSRINVAEIAWGGVRPDGIPDLQNAPNLPAGEQNYLQPSDRVFGVSINGEHRAYPLRIVNAHEMANDVLGGEPIALAY